MSSRSAVGVEAKNMNADSRITSKLQKLFERLAGFNVLTDGQRRKVDKLDWFARVENANDPAVILLMAQIWDPRSIGADLVIGPASSSKMLLDANPNPNFDIHHQSLSDVFKGTLVIVPAAGHLSFGELFSKTNLRDKVMLG